MAMVPRTLDSPLAASFLIASFVGFCFMPGSKPPPLVTGRPWAGGGARIRLAGGPRRLRLSAAARGRYTKHGWMTGAGSVSDGPPLRPSLTLPAPADVVPARSQRKGPHALVTDARRAAAPAAAV